MKIDEARDLIQSRKGSMRCSEVIEILEFFGFDHKPRRRGRHITVTHKGLVKHGFTTWGFNGEDPVPKAYLAKLRQLLDIYREGLEEIGYE